MKKKETLLAVDVGNTNMVFAAAAGDKILGKWRLATNTNRTADEYFIALDHLMRRAEIAPETVRHAIISCVVPQSLFEIKTLIRQYFGCEPLVVGERSVKIGMPIKLERPSEVGADRLVNAVAAYARYKTAAIVIDFGTATTFDVISAKGEYMGGLITPGIHLSLEALHMAAAKLPEVGIRRPEKVVGTSTVDAMQAGVYFGYLGLLEGIVARIKKERGEKMRVIATGGLASLFAEATPMIDDLEPDLTIRGLLHLFAKNGK